MKQSSEKKLTPRKITDPVPQKGGAKPKYASQMADWVTKKDPKSKYPDIMFPEKIRREGKDYYICILCNTLHNYHLPVCDKLMAAQFDYKVNFLASVLNGDNPDPDPPTETEEEEEEDEESDDDHSGNQ